DRTIRNANSGMVGRQHERARAPGNPARSDVGPTGLQPVQPDARSDRPMYDVATRQHPDALYGLRTVLAELAVAYAGVVQYLPRLHSNDSAVRAVLGETHPVRKAGPKPGAM